MKKLDLKKIIKPLKFKNAKGTLILEVGKQMLKCALVENYRHKSVISRSFSKSYRGFNTIGEILKNENLFYSEIIIIITRDLVTVRCLELPTIDPQEIVDIIEIQAAKQTPFGKDEIISDYHTIGSSREHYTKVILAIIQKEIIDSILNNFSDKKSSILKVALSSECLIGWFASVQKRISDNTFAIIALEEEYCEMCVISNGNLIFSRALQINMDDLAGQNFLSNFTEEIVYTIKAYEQEGIGSTFSQIVLAGERGLAERIIKYASDHSHSEDNKKLEEMNFSVLGLNEDLPSGMEFSLDAALSLKEHTSESFFTLFGIIPIAEKQIFNFLPGDIKKSRLKNIKKHEILVTGSLVLFVVLTVLGAVFAKPFTKTILLKSLESELGKLDEKTALLKKEKMTIEFIKKRIDVKNSAIEVLKDIYYVVPKTIHLIAINFEEGNNVSVRGSAASMSSVMEFVSLLEELDSFSNIETEYFNKRKLKDKEFVDFEVTCPFEL